MKIYTVIAFSVLICAFFVLGGFAPAPAEQETVYFTVYTDSRRLDITDKLLRGAWFNYDSQKYYAGGKNLFERAGTAKSIKKDFPEIWHLVQKIKRDTKVAPDDGDIVFDPKEKPIFKIVGQYSGRDLNEDKLCKDILTALKSGRQQSIVTDIKSVKPRDARTILSNIGLRGGYTTYFEKNDAREHNIALSLECFNGLTVRNGETVSFNKVVGPRTSVRGYREAKIILDGEFVPGVGGGVCQSSTTLFNALLAAGLTVDKSFNHSLAISYVPLGRDAMVSSASDLVFTNNTGGTIYIEAGAVQANANKTGKAYVRIYGGKTNVIYRPRTEVTEHELKQDEIIPVRESRTYIDAWAGDKLVHTKLVRKSKYKSQKAKKPAEPSQIVKPAVPVKSI